VIGEPEADRAAPSPSRVPEAKAVLTGVTAARIDAIIYASNVAVGTYLAVEFELIDAPGSWQPLEDTTDDATLDGPRLLIDPASLASLDSSGRRRWPVERLGGVRRRD
jgi:hypothetical protein